MQTAEVADDPDYLQVPSDDEDEKGNGYKKGKGPNLEAEDLRGVVINLENDVDANRFNKNEKKTRILEREVDLEEIERNIREYESKHPEEFGENGISLFYI